MCSVHGIGQHQSKYATKIFDSTKNRERWLPPALDFGICLRPTIGVCHGHVFCALAVQRKLLFQKSVDIIRSENRVIIVVNVTHARVLFNDYQEQTQKKFCGCF